jgi:hypothetical protein
VWAAIPSVHRLPEDVWKKEWRLALDVHTGLVARELGSGLNALVLSMSGNPLVDGVEVFQGGRYPTVPSSAEAILRAAPTKLGPGNWILNLHVPAESEELDKLAPKIYGGDKRALIPTLPEQSEPLSPLMLWWVLLFGLSIFARYYPALWLSALDVQHSKEAVPLESILERALELLPALVYEAIFMID